jgi:hypothetical protein
MFAGQTGGFQAPDLEGGLITRIRYPLVLSVISDCFEARLLTGAHD